MLCYVRRAAWLWSRVTPAVCCWFTALHDAAQTHFTSLESSSVRALWTDLELPVQFGGVAVARRRQQSPQWRHQVVGVDARHTAAQRRTDHVIITTHPFNGTVPFAWLPGWAGTRKVKPIWILLKQETVSGTGISRAIRKSAPCSGQITMPAPHHSVFYRPDALPAAQPTASKHWRSTRHNNNNNNNKWRRMRSKVHSSLIFVLFCIA